MRIDRTTALRQYLAGGGEPVTPRDAATIVIVRDGTEGVEVFMLRRHRHMAFGPGMYVYPGGSVETHDHVNPKRWSGPSPRAWARMLDADEHQAEALVCACIRECYEECGVLFAGHGAETICPTEGNEWERQRAALAKGQLTLGSLLDQRGLVARTDLLQPLGRWITPIFSPRRFDTRFFLARLPQGARCRDFGEESDTAGWLPVRRALEGYHSGVIPMMLATADALNTLAPHDTVADALAAPARSNVPRMVRGVAEGEGFRFVVDGPDDAVPVEEFLRSSSARELPDTLLGHGFRSD